MTKTRFKGVITITFPDGAIEKCVIQERVSKGKHHFLNVVIESLKTILEQGANIFKDSPDRLAEVTYSGDFSEKFLESCRSATVVESMHITIRKNITFVKQCYDLVAAKEEEKHV